MTFSVTNINDISCTQQIKQNYRLIIVLTLKKKKSPQIINANKKKNTPHFFTALHNSYPVNAIVFTL